MHLHTEVFYKGGTVDTQGAEVVSLIWDLFTSPHVHYSVIWSNFTYLIPDIKNNTIKGLWRIVCL